MDQLEHFLLAPCSTILAAAPMSHGCGCMLKGCRATLEQIRSEHVADFDGQDTHHMLERDITLMAFLFMCWSISASCMRLPSPARQDSRSIRIQEP